MSRSFHTLVEQNLPRISRSPLLIEKLQGSGKESQNNENNVGHLLAFLPAVQGQTPFLAYIRVQRVNERDLECGTKPIQSDLFELPKSLLVEACISIS